jgi:hypothetical protein
MERARSCEVVPPRLNPAVPERQVSQRGGEVSRENTTSSEAVRKSLITTLAPSSQDRASRTSSGITVTFSYDPRRRLAVPLSLVQSVLHFERFVTCCVTSIEGGPEIEA